MLVRCRLISNVSNRPAKNEMLWVTILTARCQIYFPLFSSPNLDTSPQIRPHFRRPSATALRSVPSGEFHPKNSRRGCKKLLFLVGSCHDAVCWSSVVLELLAVRYVHRSCCSVVCVCVCFAFLPLTPLFPPDYFYRWKKQQTQKFRCVCPNKFHTHKSLGREIIKSVCWGLLSICQPEKSSVCVCETTWRHLRSVAENSCGKNLTHTQPTNINLSFATKCCYQESFDCRFCWLRKKRSICCDPSVWEKKKKLKNNGCCCCC